MNASLRALRFLRIDHVRKALSQCAGADRFTETGNGQDEAAFDDEKLARLSRIASLGPSQEDQLYLPEVIKALDKLPPAQKRAIVLRRIVGHTEEHTAKICKVDKRTIRYRSLPPTSSSRH